mmetsp:Transcript_39243/g.98746  ORF Transcript_39243/g.98746 Transcript_39243/m.98746 type:complete len:390 (+) Transcript_39243:824-1993(+)
MVVLTVGPQVIHVEDDVNRIVRQPIHQCDIFLTQIWVGCPRRDSQLLPLLHQVSLHLVTRVDLLASHSLLWLGHPADCRQHLDVLHTQCHVGDLIRPSLLLHRNRVVFVIILLAFAVRPLARGSVAGRFLSLVLILLPPLGQVVDLPLARLPEADPIPLLAGHDPHVLHKPGFSFVLAFYLDGPFANVGVLLGAQEDRTKEQGVVLHRSLSCEKERLRILPAILWQLAKPLLPRGVAEGDAIDPMHERKRPGVLMRRDDLAREGHQWQILHRLRVLPDAKEAPQIDSLIERFRLSRTCPNGIWKGLRILLGKSRPGGSKIFLLLFPFRACTGIVIQLLHEDVVWPIGVEIGLKVNVGSIGVGQRTPQKFCLSTIEETNFPLLLEPLLVR